MSLPPHASPWVRIVIVAYNAGDWLARSVAALAGQTDPHFEAVIIDNASTDDAVATLVLPDARFQIIRAPQNLGFAAGCNLGARDADTPWLAMLNPDAIPRPTWLAALRAATMRHAHTAMFGSTQLSADDESLADGLGDVYSIFGLAWRGGYGLAVPDTLADRRVFSPCAAAALYRRDAFAATGGFAEEFFCYLEDVDLGFRLRLEGHQAVQVADARVVHKGSASTGRDSPFTLFHSSRNGVLMLVRCMPMPLLILALPMYVLAQAALAWRGRGGAMPRLSGVVAGLARMGSTLPRRRMIRRRRRIEWMDAARLLVWRPKRLLTRDAVHYPWPPAATKTASEG